MGEDSFTQRHPDLEKETVSYVLNTELSESGREAILKLQGQLKERLGKVLWLLPPDALHITLMDWLAPFVEYGDDPDKLFREHRHVYEEALREVLADIHPISVHFERIQVSPSTIHIEGSEDGSFAEIRGHFLEQIELLPGTKPAPDIVHASVARFTGKTDLREAEECVSDLSIDLTELVQGFRLVRETKLPMLEYEIIEEFSLK